MAIPTGSMLKSQYRIDALIGGGGMALVYRAFDMNLQRVCAIKQNMYTASAAQQQFHLEAVTLANLNHPHLVRVLDHFIDIMGQQYLVMEFVEGENLDQFIKRVGAMPESHALVWMAGVLDAVSYCHSKGVIHRDIKPANLVKRQDQASLVLVDFGIAKQMASGVTPPGAKAASAAFAPPEQLLGSRTDFRSDIYALGATLYYLLTGQEPPNPLLIMAGTQRLMSPRAFNPGISPTTEKAIMRAMAQDMHDRPATVADFVRLLQASGGVVSHRRAARWTTAALAVVALLATTVLAAPKLPEWIKSVTAAASTPTVTTVAPAVTPTVPAVVATTPTASLAVTPTEGLLPSTVGLGAGDNPTTATLAQPSPEGANVSSSSATTPGVHRGPTSTPLAEAAPSGSLVASATPAPSTATPVSEPLPQAEANLTPCPSYLHRPLPGMGLLLIENHLGEPLHIDNIATGESWDLPPKQEDIPSRLVLDLPPGSHTLVDNTYHGHGRIGIDIEAGAAYVSPIWYNDRTEEVVYPQEIPDGCQ